MPDFRLEIVQKRMKYPEMCVCCKQFIADMPMLTMKQRVLFYGLLYEDKERLILRRTPATLDYLVPLLYGKYKNQRLATAVRSNIFHLRERMRHNGNGWKILTVYGRRDKSLKLRETGWYLSYEPVLSGNTKWAATQVAGKAIRPL